MIKLTTLLLMLFCFLNNNETNASVKNTTLNYETNSSTTNNTDPVRVDNADVGIFPGENNFTIKYVPKTRILAQNVDIIVTGIKSAKHGKKILVVATNGDITFVPHCTNSYGRNRIKYDSNMTIPQGSAFELTYNGYIKKWVITNKNPQ